MVTGISGHNCTIIGWFSTIFNPISSNFQFSPWDNPFPPLDLLEFCWLHQETAFRVALLRRSSGVRSGGALRQAAEVCWFSAWRCAGKDGAKR